MLPKYRIYELCNQHVVHFFSMLRHQSEGDKWFLFLIKTLANPPHLNFNRPSQDPTSMLIPRRKTYLVVSLAIFQSLNQPCQKAEFVSKTRVKSDMCVSSNWQMLRLCRLRAISVCWSTKRRCRFWEYQTSEWARATWICLKTHRTISWCLNKSKRRW